MHSGGGQNNSRMGRLHTIERSPSRFSITSSTSLSVLDFYTRLAPKSQPTTTLSSIVVSSSDSGIASGGGVQHRTASLRLKSMMKSSVYDDEKKLHESDDSDEGTNDILRGRRPRYPSLPVGRFMSSITRNFSVSSSRTPSPPPPPRPRLRPPRIIITPPPSPRKIQPSHSISHAAHSPLTSTTTTTTTTMNPILAKLERESKFCGIQMVCSTCGKIGHGYPCCGRCGDMWCSRECRLGSGGKKHVCRKAI